MMYLQGKNRAEAMTYLIRSLAVPSIILLFALSVASGRTMPRANKCTNPNTHTFGKIQEEDIPNFGEVTPTLYRGGQPRDAGFETLARLGVNIVVDAASRNKREEKEVQKLGMQYVAMPWRCMWPRDEVFANFLKLLQENKGKKVFVHCRGGKDRTGMMVAAYRMAEEGWSPDRAMKEMQASGFSRIHHLICPGLARYQQEFPERLKTRIVFEGVRSQH